MLTQQPKEIVQELLYMKTKDAIMELRERQAFWSGVARGAIGAAAFLVGLVTVVYYVVQITMALK